MTTSDSDTATPQAGTTRPAGEELTDDEAVAETGSQTSSDLKAEDVFERESDGADSDAAAADESADDIE